MSQHNDNARDYFRRIVEKGHPPNGIAPEDCGPYKEHALAVSEAYDRDGTEGARSAYEALTRVDPRIAELVAGDPDPESLEPGGGLITDLSNCPPLPEKAKVSEELGSGACQWLDDYIDFSQQWSPRGYRGYHEACGIWLLSTIAARRVELWFGKKRYPSLYLLLVGRTSVHAKSTTADIAIATLKAAGLRWLLASDDSTPQKFIADLTEQGAIPADYDTLSPEEQQRVLNQLALPAQRGWFYEEFGQHLYAINRSDGHMAEFRGIIRRFDDHKERYEYGSISRGTDVVKNPYLALLGNLTPADLRPFAKRGSSMWRDGFWARFAFVTAPAYDRKRGRFPKGERTVPAHLVKPLEEWHQQLGTPEVAIKDVLNEDNKPTGKKRVERSGPIPTRRCTLGNGVYDAYYQYHDTLLDMITGTAYEDLDGNYTRFAEKALRVAMLFASLENDGQIEMQHWARAQAITERWRADLHELMGQLDDPGPSEQEIREHKVFNKLRNLVEEKGKDRTAAQVARYVHGMAGSEVEKILEDLARLGYVTTREAYGTKYYKPVGQSTE